MRSSLWRRLAGTGEEVVIKQYDTVRLRHGLPEEGLPAGTLAAVLDVYDEPTPGYEIEVVGTDGRTIFLGSVDPDQVEPA
jgi:hypothetical protein